MSRVESYCIDGKVLTCLDVVLILDGESIFNCMIKMLIGSSLPFSCWLLYMSCFYLCGDHQFIDGSRLLWCSFIFGGTVVCLSCKVSCL